MFLFYVRAFSGVRTTRHAFVWHPLCCNSRRDDATASGGIAMRLMTRTVFAALLLCLCPAVSAAYECDAASGLCLVADDDHAMRYDDEEAMTMREVADATPASTPNTAEPYRSY
jgi:hypothetical protein